MSKPLEQLKERLGKITDLERVGRVLSWDQQTMMPPAGSEHRPISDCDPKPYLAYLRAKYGAGVAA